MTYVRQDIRVLMFLVLQESVIMESIVLSGLQPARYSKDIITRIIIM